MSEFVAYVKAHIIKDGTEEGAQGQLGACPFSHRVLLVLEEKGLPYQLEYINLDKKPDWLKKVNPLSNVPILQDKSTQAYIVDSDTISDYLETKFGPGAEIERTQLGTVAECPQPGKNIWPSFWEFLSTGKGKEAFKAELKQINDAVGDSQPFVGGQDPCAWDVALAPRLYLARVGCKILKQWDLGNDFPNVKSYLHRWTGRSSWRNTASWDDESIIEDFKHKLAKEQEK